MSGLKIHEKSCIGCGLCVKSCAYHALRIEEKKAKVNPDACVLCGICVETCPVNAMELRRKRGAAAEEIASTGVWVFAQQQDGRPLQVALELLSKARELADDLNEPLTAVFSAGTAGARDFAQTGRGPGLSLRGCADACPGRRTVPACFLRADRAAPPGCSALRRHAFRALSGAAAGRAAEDRAHRGLHGAGNRPGNQPFATDPPGLRRQPDGHHRLPGSQAPDGHRPARRYAGFRTQL
jgi:NAD-dependent dihydropyrimidine dehydrogenase PreA subunit